MTNKRIVVVLAMHRSGSSVLTRSLTLFNINLGDNLAGPVLGDNDKGYFEDISLNNINIDILKALNSDWDRITPPLLSQLNRKQKKEFEIRAINFIETSLKNGKIFALKDPRMVVLLPFWLEVFRVMALDVKFLVPVRNPLAIAASLNHRYPFSFTRAIYLFRLYYNIIIAPKEYPSLYINFDELVANPILQLTRISAFLNIKIDLKSAEVKSYVSGFIDPMLRHHQAKDQSLQRINKSYPFLIPLYKYLQAKCRLVDTIDSDESPPFPSDQVVLDSRSEMLCGLVNYGDILSSRKDQHLSSYEKTTTELHAHITELNGRALASDEAIRSYEKAAQTSDYVTAELKAIASDQASLIEKLTVELSQSIRLGKVFAVGNKIRTKLKWIPSSRQTRR